MPLMLTTSPRPDWIRWPARIGAGVKTTSGEGLLVVVVMCTARSNAPLNVWCCSTAGGWWDGSIDDYRGMTMYVNQFGTGNLHGRCNDH